MSHVLNILRTTVTLQQHFTFDHPERGELKLAVLKAEWDMPRVMNGLDTLQATVVELG